MLSPDELLAAARAARERAYAPYSGFAVGAALETFDGTVITGCNVENASFGMSICAERTAIVSAVAQGYQQFRAIAVAGPDGAITSPCGACRQFIAEFDPQMPVYFTTPDADVQTTLDKLLPYSFGPKSLQST
jgi:cytidine deaminase